MQKLDARGVPCPKPIIMTKLALEEDPVVSVTVNEEALEDLKKLADKLEGTYSEKKLKEDEYEVNIEVKDTVEKDQPIEQAPNQNGGGTVIMIGKKVMGTGPEELGTILMNGLIFTIDQTAPLPSSIIFYNDGIFLTTKENDALEDIKNLADEGVEILSCGTCLNYHDVEAELKVGGTTNMYEIFQKLGKASQVITLE
ncbi:MULTISPECIES: sulfurtransferase-like selenium metabolism protein YedF [Loigolactobacillus]|uniref:Uncharacterized protein n=1 Tax=Loigolactobacillus backii TaxID=375175 RepID=A0A192H2L6_9LACO|nr:MULTISPECIES: sulfurtransferase-like selenium metabolism protein YedF [Loigolactobacillus]ANK59121.1 hypothetical protein AYR52_01870 [Loigolactobacillus backii]ANK62523.1 hypothetical protein AYR53_06935 [Loigolactobacillus backii]ANK64110.1 hypothetical protein AYR54_01860 [Loigolactobacillus backii]ANK67496.1 hypothetical protein AYR55_07180 [Loigolactobacillus backii]ANK70467.1 hypothetical protein AYR56_10065 [Loigolactobacillus backii]